MDASCGCCATSSASTSPSTRRGRSAGGSSGASICCGSVDLREYVEQLRRDPDELNALYQDLLIGVTRFFRDPEAFEFLEQRRDSRNPRTRTRKRRDPHLGRRLRHRRRSLLARDDVLRAADMRHGRPAERQDPRDRRAPGIARRMRAPASMARSSSNMSAKRPERFFTQASSGYQISQDLRQLIVFAPHNITKDAPFTKMHFISCRNMLIYSGTARAEERAVAVPLRPCVGRLSCFWVRARHPGALAHEFDTVDEHWKIYRKRRDVGCSSRCGFPLQRRRPALRDRSLASRARPWPIRRSSRLYDQLLDRHMPPSFLVNEDRQLIDSFGGAEQNVPSARSAVLRRTSSICSKATCAP